jgi:hypothetical protein
MWGYHGEKATEFELPFLDDKKHHIFGGSVRFISHVTINSEIVRDPKRKYMRSNRTWVILETSLCVDENFEVNCWRFNAVNLIVL